MKTRITLVATLIITLFHLNSHAQIREFSLGYGVLGRQEIQVRDISNFVETKFSGTIGENTKKTFSPLGPIRLAYTMYDTKHITLGADLSYAACQSEMQYANGTSEKSDFHFFTLMGNVSYQYLDNPKLNIYSGLHFGVSYLRGKNLDTNKKGEDYLPAYHVTLLGVRYGEKLGVYGDLGYGYNGYVNAGVFYRLIQ
ncbi:MAG: hypothetical protein LCH37_04325 [Bacteroidetes bacterium]|nr:hypothetical protein [Bacteroidota bacterium]